MHVELIFPHQLFKRKIASDVKRVYLIEEDLFFNQYAFHKAKIAFHRATMKSYVDELKSMTTAEIIYIESIDPNADIKKLITRLKQEGVQTISVSDVTDNWLKKGISSAAKQHDIVLKWKGSRLFINRDLSDTGFFRTDKKKYFQTSYYKSERKRLGLMMTAEEEPEGGKWTFDVDNRKPFPKDRKAPPVPRLSASDVWTEAREYAQKNYPNNPGSVPDHPLFPITRQQSKEWFEQFMEVRLYYFGDYEDAIVANQHYLHHAVISPMLNIGLLDPLECATKVANDPKAPVNSREGFVRQIIGWREFIRGIYEVIGTKQRTSNFWGFERKIPKSFYTGETGIPPIDNTIKKLLKTGYSHHIERLMILGNFMVLCEFDPDEVYRWFMEMYIDAYDWVMVPNVYGMSQFADGGSMTTKPYISGSNYIKKMSNYETGSWTETWDSLFWRFMHVHRDFFEQNPRLRMLTNNLDRMSDDKLNNYLSTAEDFLSRLDNENKN